MNTISFTVNTLGWIGSIAVICAYGLISMNKVQSKSGFYQLLNLGGAIGLMLNTSYHGAYPSAFVNSVWLIIAAVALVRIRQSVPAKNERHLVEQKEPITESPP